MTERDIFLEALEVATLEARAAYLRGACGGDVTLRRKVEELLKEHFSNDSLLAGPAVKAEQPSVTFALAPEAAPAQIIGHLDRLGAGHLDGLGAGRYKLLEKIGEGGFGEVWMAEQREPVKRRVALKLIKLGMDSRQIVARFEAERQALAMMDHPNIAKIFDAGTTRQKSEVRGQKSEIGDQRSEVNDQQSATDSRSFQSTIASTGSGQVGNRHSEIAQGRPYFVMELVRGIKITEYCDQNKLPTRERLGLFILVCQAIQHAHQKGIIHRDIKPSNILVTLHDGVPVPKVIDFGIAKATQQELTDKTVFTQFQQFMGTPAYISPEQAEMSGLDIDTRADIYSLGVLLYELLVGQTPFDAKEMVQGGLDALRKVIREKEPLRPSTKLNTLPGDLRTTAGKRRQTEVGKLVHQLQGDLDWIVMKCLEKDRTRRYETANGLAADLQRHLKNEPVLARPPSAAYKFQKAWQRNKLAFTAVAVVLLALVAGIGASTWQALRATRAEHEQNRQREAAVEASASEAVQRKLADTQRDVAVEQRKLADMQLALQMWEEGDVHRANELINASRPEPGLAPAFEWRYLRELCRDQSIATFGTPNDPYRSALFFERDLLLLNGKKTLTLKNVSSGEEQLLLEDRDGIWNPVLCSHDTNLLATATDDGRIKVWDIATTRVRVEFEGNPRSPNAPDSPFYACTFSRDGRWLASASGDNSVKLWDVESRNPKPVWTVRPYSHSANAVVFSPDGRQLFSGGSEAMIRAWSVATGVAESAPLDGHTAWVRALAASPDGLWMASGSGDSTVVLWDATSHKLERRLFGHTTGVMALAFSPDQQILASGGYDGTIRLWDLKTGQLNSLLRGHAATVKRLSFSPNGRLLASQSEDGLVKLWHATPSAEDNTLTGSPRWLQHVALSPDGRRLASVALDTFAVNLWNLPDRSRIVLTGHTSFVLCAAFSPDGRIVATGSHDQTVRLWDVSDHTTVAMLTNGFPVGSVAFSPDGRTLVAGGSMFHHLVGDRAGLQFWDVPSQQPTGTIAGDASDIVHVAWSDSGSLLATGHKDGHISLWDPQTRRILHRFGKQSETSVISLAFSPTEPLLAAGDYAGTIVLYTTTTMEVLAPPLKSYSGPGALFARPTPKVMSLAFSPDGRTLASTGEGAGLKLWQVASRQVALTLKGHAGPVVAAVFSRDGNFMVSCGADATVRLWPAGTLKQAE